MHVRAEKRYGTRPWATVQKVSELSAISQSDRKRKARNSTRLHARASMASKWRSMALEMKMGGPQRDECRQGGGWMILSNSSWASELESVMMWIGHRKT